ncbi:tetratricopeptide repeat protein [Arthrobacter sp. zg.Y919]|nr:MULTISPECIES: tetratricopeptide repeat protein [unclassified Arthrobacter]MCC9145067.1 tetratricopeptide repeat protein [Arthrobacter sp. zg-Y919]MDK1276295.1 tetratricopeptide repeat protein [Arthrobacter sp. zg.Y919]WIB04552.1 tetratricopeptide repeat protein [Arthrobacter sp. zg-Y919]
MDNWETRVQEFWAQADDTDPATTLRSMKALVDEQPDGDAAALFEWASVHDFLGQEAEAIPLYRLALDAGLDDRRRIQALIQLASSLRNVGESEAAIQVLEGVEENNVAGDAHRAFLALALFDAGRQDQALRVALEALAKTLPLYRRAVTGYAAELLTSG